MLSILDINKCLLHTNILARLRGKTIEIEVSSMSIGHAQYGQIHLDTATLDVVQRIQ